MLPSSVLLSKLNILVKTYINPIAIWAKINEFLMSADPLKIFLKIIGDPRKNSIVSEIALYWGALYRGPSVFISQTLKTKENLLSNINTVCHPLW